MVATRQLIVPALFTLSLTNSLSSQAQIDAPTVWQSPLYVDHILVGKIWDSALGDFIAPGDLLAGVENRNYILLGEKHDNPDHHLLQQTLLTYFLQQGRLSRVAFEMLEDDKQELLENISRQDFSTLDELKSYLDWDEEGWDWSFYGSLIQSAYLADISIAAANISTDAMMQVYREDLSPEIAEVLGESIMTQLELDIDESHCGLLPETQFPSMVKVQQARDYAMAQSLGGYEAGQLNVLIAGNYHVRHDLGVPNYLLAGEASLSRDQIASIAFMEVDNSETEAAAYLQKFGDVRAYDYIWFTPAISDEDYCASLRQEEAK